MRNPPSASLFGKLPSALDFVRIHHNYPEALALDRWLAASQQYLQAHGQGWPEESLNFCFVPEGAEHGIVGVLAPSKDRAGRKYPAAIFAPFPRELLAAHYPAVPVACAKFFDAAAACLDGASTLPLTQLAASVARLPLSAADELSVMYRRLDAQLCKRSELDGLRQEERDGVFKELVDATRAAAQEWNPVVREYPVCSHDHASTWLWLTQLADASATPAFAWRAGVAGRVLLAPNGFDPRLLSWWSVGQSAYVRHQPDFACDASSDSALRGPETLLREVFSKSAPAQQVAGPRPRSAR